METSLLAIEFSEFQLFSDSKDELCATRAHPVSNIQHRGTEVDVSRSIIAVVRFGARARIGVEAVQMSGRLKVNYKKASQADCDQVFGYGDKDVFCV